MKDKYLDYVTPAFEVLKLELESAILVGSAGNVENPIEGEESDW
jgi:hypothetical protein